MNQEMKKHLKRFTGVLKDALKAKTSWGRNELFRLIDMVLIDYFIDENDLEMEEKGAIEALTQGAKNEEIVQQRGSKRSKKAGTPPL